MDDNHQIQKTEAVWTYDKYARWPTIEDGDFRHGRGSQTKRKISKKMGGRHHRLVSDGSVCGDGDGTG